MLKVQQRKTGRYIHQLWWVLAADATSHESTTVFRYRQFVEQVKRCQVHLEMNRPVYSENYNKFPESYERNHWKWWMNRYTRRRACGHSPQSGLISSPSIWRVSRIPANALDKDDKQTEPDPCRMSAVCLPKQFWTKFWITAICWPKLSWMTLNMITEHTW